jgi:hypothetical protein
MNWKKAITYGALAIATGYGTFRDNEGIAPLGNIYINKRNNGGIRIGVINENGGTFNGLCLGVANGSTRTVDPVTRGIELALISNGGDGMLESKFDNNYVQKIYGLQVSLLVNRARSSSKGLQVGLVNLVIDEQGRTVNWNPIFNVMSGYKSGGSQ